MFKCLHIFETALPFWMHLDSMTVGIRRVTKWGISSMSTRWWQHAQDWRWVLCAVKRNGGRKEVLKHLTETNTAIQYGLFGCIHHELLEIQPTRLLLKVTGRLCRQCPSHGPPPNPNSLPSRFTSRRIVFINAYYCFAHSEHHVFK